MSLAPALAARDAFASYTGTELGVPCFLYGPERSLPEIRRRAFVTESPDIGPHDASPDGGSLLRRRKGRARRVQPVARGRRCRARPGDRPLDAPDGGEGSRPRARREGSGLLQPCRALAVRAGRGVRLRLPPGAGRPRRARRSRAGVDPGRDPAASGGASSTWPRTARSRRGSWSGPSPCNDGRPTGGLGPRIRKLRDPSEPARGHAGPCAAPARSCRPRCRTSHRSRSRTRGSPRERRNRGRPPSPRG